MPKYIFKCAICGKEFQALLPHAKYCSPECAQQAHYERVNKGKLTYNKVCPTCGKRFNTVRAEQQFCSMQCCGVGIKLHKPKEKQKCPSHFELRAREADECGLSYGKYTAQLRLGKSFEELKKEYEIKKYGRQGIFE